jgi:hypothetical protein
VKIAVDCVGDRDRAEPMLLSLLQEGKLEKDIWTTTSQSTTRPNTSPTNSRVSLAMSHPILFEDIFEVKQLNPDGKKFERGRHSQPAQPASFVFHVPSQSTEFIVVEQLMMLI